MESSQLLWHIGDTVTTLCLWVAQPQLEKLGFMQCSRIPCWATPVKAWLNQKCFAVKAEAAHVYFCATFQCLCFVLMQLDLKYPGSS